jgi:serine/threonine-protein kinase
MEMLEGQTLRQRLGSGLPLPRPEVLHILRGVCSALGAAHDRALVHRDLKPENIFLHRQASGIVPKVLDFGLARAFETARSLTGSTRIATSGGLLIGTLEYMAPEQVAGDDVNPGWDLWALAVIAYEMLTGTHPFRRRLDLPLGPIDDAGLPGRGDGAPTLSEDASAFFRTALSSERTLRPAEPQAFLLGIEHALV